MESSNAPETPKVFSQWVAPFFEDERGEMERVLKDFLNLEPNAENMQHLLEILQESPIVELSEEEWRLLENTDSYENIRPGHIEDALQITEKYNSDLLPEHKRDFEKLLDGFQSGKEMQTAIILKNAAGRMHLVSGNTRLMIARALGVQPKVLIAQF